MLALTMFNTSLPLKGRLEVFDLGLVVLELDPPQDSLLLDQVEADLEVVLAEPLAVHTEPQVLVVVVVVVVVVELAATVVVRFSFFFVFSIFLKLLNLSGGGRPGAGSEIPIIRYENVNNGDGTYQFLYETGNGINAQEQGDARGDGTQAQGSFSYTAPDGQQIQLQYTADGNGYNPQGAHIPTPPPIPPEIQKSIEQNLADEARGIPCNFTKNQIMLKVVCLQVS